MEQTVIYLSMAQIFIILKQKIVPNIVCLGKVSKYFAVDNMKKTGFMILVLIIRQFLLLLYHTFIKIWWLKMR